MCSSHQPEEGADSHDLDDGLLGASADVHLRDAEPGKRTDEQWLDLADQVDMED